MKKGETKKKEEAKTKTAAGEPRLEELVLQALDEVIDPEIGVSVVKMGLIKSVKVSRGEVRIRMTVTSPFCPLKDFLTQAVKRKAERVNGVRKASVELVLPEIR